MNAFFSERFNAIVAKYPQHVALESHGSPITYSALHQWAARIGGTLRSHGVGPETIVGIALDRSPEMVAAMVGIWWAGGAFLPLDLRWPSERLEFVVRDAQFQFAITNEAFASRLQTLGVRTFAPHVAGPATSCHSTRVNDLAYVIYTSGSTGRPKGVLVEHRGLVNLLDEQIRAFALDANTRSLWMLNPAFDASVSDLGTVLLAGGTLVIEADERLRDPVQLARLLHDRSITYVDLPPAFLSLLDEQALPASLRTVCIGGEPAPAERVRAWAATRRVVNVYGPTEATVCTSLGVCDTTWNEPLLGQPIAHTHYRIDPVVRGESASMSETEAWVRDGCRPRGELLIGGPGLARGYLNRPELTAAKFISLDGQRWYRTGDRVRQRSDGEYVFLGRVDRQFKWRGQLIEPEEIEQRLSEQPAVRAAAVVKRLVAQQETLVAFVETDRVDGSTIRDVLKQQVPHFMVPNHVELVHCIPRTSNGKVDYAALLRSPLTRPPIHDQTPIDDLEAALMRVWSAVLGRPSIDRQAGFLSQGGDSLRVFACVMQADAVGLTIPPVLLADDRPFFAVADHLRSCAITNPLAMSADVLRRDALEIMLTLTLPTTNRQRDYSPPRTILLTGATGFLGSWVLRELLRQTNATIVCLVRASDPTMGLARLAVTSERIAVVCGDLAERRFGLSATDWETLASRIDTIYHVGAMVNMVAPYQALRAANVVGASELLNLMAEGEPKRLHYASTLSVFVATDRPTGRFMESDDLASTRQVFGGYAQSKWAAEFLLRQTNDALGDIVHYRFGLITGDQQTGRGNVSDIFSLFVRGLARIGALPEGVNEARAFDLTPVDFAAQAFVALSLQVQNATYHLAQRDGTTLRMLVHAFRERGYPLPTLSRDDWWQRWNHLREREPLLASACRCLVDDDLANADRTMELFQATNVQFDTTNTEHGLRHAGIEWPLVNGELLTRYVQAILDH